MGVSPRHQYLKGDNMDCVKSLEVLSDFHSRALNEMDQEQVREHLAKCSPCVGVLQDIGSIVAVASVLCVEEGICFPDENIIWQRLTFAKGIAH